MSPVLSRIIRLPLLLSAAALLSFLLPAPADAVISFGAPAAINSTASADSDDPNATNGEDTDIVPRVANDGAGTWVSVWASDNPLGGTVGADLDIFFARSTDDGATWSDAAALYPAAATDGGVPDNQPRVAAGAGGVWVTVFSSSNTLGGTTGVDQDILFSRSTDGGATWSDPALLNSGGAVDGALDTDFQASIATDGAGDWVVTWKHSTLGGMDPTADRVFYSYSTDNGASWSAEQLLGSPQLVNVGLGQGTSVTWNGTSFVAAWGSTEDLGSNGNEGDILSSIITPPGFAASPAVLVNSTGTTDSGIDSFPSLAANGTDVVAVWESASDIGGAGVDKDIFFATSSNGGATWSAAAPLQSNATTDVGADVNAHVANDGSTFLVVWDSTDPLDKLIKTDRDILFARSDDSGATWTDVEALASTARKDKGNDLLPVISANEATGTWIAVWESRDSLFKSIGTDQDILHVRAAPDCPAMPAAAASCFETTVAGKSALTIKEKGAKDSLIWKFVKGPAVDKAMDLGSPLTTDDYLLCVYDRSAGIPELVTELDMPAGGACFVKPCWSDTTPGFLYKNKYGAASVVSLNAGFAGKSKASVKAQGAFRAPALPLDQGPTVSARLHNLGNGRCFAADFSTAKTNDSGMFKASSD